MPVPVFSGIGVFTAKDAKGVAKGAKVFCGGLVLGKLPEIRASLFLSLGLFPALGDSSQDASKDIGGGISPEASTDSLPNEKRSE